MPELVNIAGNCKIKKSYFIYLTNFHRFTKFEKQKRNFEAIKKCLFDFGFLRL